MTHLSEIQELKKYGIDLEEHGIPFESFGVEPEKLKFVLNLLDKYDHERPRVPRGAESIVPDVKDVFPESISEHLGLYLTLLEASGHVLGMIADPKAYQERKEIALFSHGDTEPYAIIENGDPSDYGLSTDGRTVTAIRIYQISPTGKEFLSREMIA